MPRWNTGGPEGKYLLKLFKDFERNPKKGANPRDTHHKYIRESVWEKHPIFQTWQPKRFYVTYRRLANEYLLDYDRSGKRGIELMFILF